MFKIALVFDCENRKIKESFFGMAAMVKTDGSELFALVTDGNAYDLRQEFESHGITNIVDITLAEDQKNNPEVRAKAFVNIIKKFNINAFLGLSTAFGRDILPRVAAMLDAPLVMDCVNVDLDRSIASTSQYSGKTMAEIEVAGDVLIFGIRPGCIDPARIESGHIPRAGMVKFDARNIVSEKLKVIKALRKGRGGAPDLAEADIIIAGGRGMQKGENFAILARCAEKLNAAVGASRVAVDSGWVPYSMQVGQTGEKVSPRVYIACGISGSIQHFAGMKTSGMVIAINTDPNAAIISNCDYYVTADALEIISQLTKLLKNG